MKTIGSIRLYAVNWSHIPRGECCISTDATNECWWLGPICELATRLLEFQKADCVCYHSADLPLIEQQLNTTSHASA